VTPRRLGDAGDWQRLAGRLVELRRARQMSQFELGRAIGLSAAYIDGLERGQHRPRTWRLRKLAAVLGADYGELAGLAGYSAAGDT